MTGELLVELLEVLVNGQLKMKPVQPSPAETGPQIATTLQTSAAAAGKCPTQRLAAVPMVPCTRLLSPVPGTAVLLWDQTHPVQQWAVQGPKLAAAPTLCPRSPTWAVGLQSLSPQVAVQVQHAAAPAQTAQQAPPATAFDFASYSKQQAQLVNAALDRLVPLQHPESITEPMRCVWMPRHPLQ